jgi:hypothetical protein
MRMPLAVAGLTLVCFCALNDAAFAQPREKCDFVGVKETYLRKYPPFAAAEFALEDLEKKLPGKEAFSYDPQQQEPLRERAKKLFSLGRLEYDRLLKTIVQQQSLACVVCGLKVSYETAVRAQQGDVTVAELSDAGVSQALEDVAKLIGTLEYWKGEYERRVKEYGENSTEARQAKRELEQQQDLIKGKLKVLFDFRENHPGLKSPKMSEMINKYDCFYT